MASNREKKFSLRPELSDAEKELGFEHPPSYKQVMNILDLGPNPHFDEVNAATKLALETLMEEGCRMLVVYHEYEFMLGPIERSASKRYIYPLHYMGEARTSGGDGPTVSESYKPKKQFWPQYYWKMYEQKQHVSMEEENPIE